MLLELAIKNFAIIDELNISFAPGLNVLTGETGAGKTIIISALNLILGDKASPEYIRSGESTAGITACFDISGHEHLKQMLTAQGIDCPNNNLILKRQLKQGTKSSCYANGELISLAYITQFSQELIDIHGQHQHQLLLKSDTHIDFLDAFGNLLGLQQQVTENFTTLQNSQSQLNLLQIDNRQKSEKKQLLEFQIQEIDSLQLDKNEKEALLKQRAILQNSEKLLEAGSFIYESIYNANGSVTEKLAQAKDRLNEMQRVDASLAPYLKTLESMQCELDDLALSLNSYTEKVEYDPQRQQEIETRLAEIDKLERKYGGSLTSVLNYRQEIEAQLQNLTNLDQQIKAASQQIDAQTQQINQLATELSSKRKHVIKDIDRLMSTELGQLGMQKSKFITRITPVNSPQAPTANAESIPRYTGGAKGIDQIEFLFTANEGERAKPLAKIASGGEISRLMLALKGLLAGGNRTPTLVFDEVDVGIGGGIAEVVGKKLKSLSKSHQLICITHLPQIAAFADLHFTAGKSMAQGRTITSIKELDQQAKTSEIARMLAGEKITPTALKHAQEMLANSRV